MSLKYILQEWAKETGQPTSSAAQRANALDKINKAAKELYESTDLPGSLFEQVFDLNFASKEVTLPYYVGQIRGVRHYNSRDHIKLNDMRPRYAYGNWIQNLLSFRIKKVIPLGRNLTNEAPLEIRLSEAASQAFSMYIKMSTSTRSSIVEQVSFAVGEISKFTTNAPTSFPGIQNIEKSQRIVEDLQVLDSNQVVVAAIPNNELQSRYTLLQVVDENIVYVQVDPCYEILYKVKLSPFFDDYDVFPCEGYDDAIVWKSVSNFWKKVPNSTDKVNMADATLATILAQKAADSEAGEELEMNFTYNRFMDIQSGGFPTGAYNDLPYRTI